MNLDPVQSEGIVVGQNHKKTSTNNTQHMQNAHFTIHNIGLDGLNKCTNLTGSHFARIVC